MKDHLHKVRKVYALLYLKAGKKMRMRMRMYYSHSQWNEPHHCEGGEIGASSHSTIKGHSSESWDQSIRNVKLFAV